MTGLKNNNYKKPLFPKVGLKDKIIKLTMKASYSEIDIVKDILDVVKNLKQTINELEDIAKELQQKVDTGTKTFIRKKRDTKIRKS